MSRFKEDQNNTAPTYNVLLSYLEDAYTMLYEAYIDISTEKRKEPYRKPKTTKTWHIENVITKDLVDLAEDKSIDKNLYFTWITEAENRKRNNRIDIAIIYPYCLGSERILGIECKHFINKASNQKYIDDGIKRFESGYYSPLMSIGGMLGYIEKGNAGDIVSGINLKCGYTELKEFQFRSTFTNTYISHLDRSVYANCIPHFKLFHFFLDFNELIGRE